MSETSQQYVTFELGGELYGLDIRGVKEVYPKPTITPVPLAETRFRGLVNIRGQIVLVVDIRVTFGNKPDPVPEGAQIVVLKTAEEVARMRGRSRELDPDRFSDKPVGLLVGRVGDVVRVQEDSLKPPPPHMADHNTRFIEGVVRVGTRLMVVLDAPEML